MEKLVLIFGFIFVFAQVFVAETFAQKSKTPAKKVPTKTVAANLPKVTQIDKVELKNLLKREGENAKPLLINFWATWCDPCREEFPELVKINADYKGKIDFITISLDDLAEINRDVPKFLINMKATMPAYLLKTDDEEAAIAAVSKNWQGGLPFTVLLNEKGEIAYVRQGKIKTETVRAEIDKIIVNKSITPSSMYFYDLSKEEQKKYYFEKGQTEARKDTANGKYLIKRYGLVPGSPPELRAKLKKKYNIEIIYYGCLTSNGDYEYGEGYNEISMAEMKRKFGDKVLAKLGF